MILHNRADAERQGFAFTGHTLQCGVPSWGAQQRVARLLNVRAEDLTLLRVAPGVWEAYTRPNAQAGYVARPFMPPSAPRSSAARAG